MALKLEDIEKLFDKKLVSEDTRALARQKYAAPAEAAPAPADPVAQYGARVEAEKPGVEMMATPVAQNYSTPDERAKFVNAQAEGQVLSKMEGEVAAKNEAAAAAEAKAAQAGEQSALLEQRKAALGLTSAPAGATPVVASEGKAGVKLASDASGQPIPVDSASPLDSSFDLARKGIAMGANAEMKQADAAAAAARKATEQLEKLDAARIVAEEERRNQADDAYKNYRQAADDAAKQGEIDPNRFYKNQSTGSKIAMGIAVFLGGFSKDGNHVLKMLQDSVDRDIDAQKAAANQAKGKLDNARNLYGDMLKKFGDERQADIASRLAVVSNMEMKIKAEAAKYASPQVAARATMALAQLEQQRGVLDASFKQATAVQQAKQRLAGGGPGNVGADLEALPTEERARFVNVGGVRGFAPTPARAEKFSAFAQEVTSARSNIDELMTMDRGLPLTEQRARANTLQQALIGQLRVAILGPGTVTESERKLMENMVANPSLIFTAQAKPKLEQLKKILDKKMNTAAEAEGIRTLKLNEAK